MNANLTLLSLPQHGQQIKLISNEDTEIEHHEVSARKYHEIRANAKTVVIPPVIRTTGPLNLRSPYILLQGLQVHAIGPNADVKIFADKHLDLQGHITRVQHAPFTIKKKGCTYLVEGFNDEFLNNAFFASATVSLGAGVKITGFEPLHVGNKPQISAPSIEFAEPELESGQTVTLVSQKKTNKRLASFVSLAVGMALNFFLPGAGTAIGAMVQATGTAAASQFAGNVVAHNGDFGHALKDMRSKQAMRSLIAAAATANFGGQSAPISSVDQFVEQLPVYLAKGMGTGALSAAIQKQNILRGIGEGATFGFASAVGNFGATTLGEAYNYGDGQIGYVQHKLGHMALGGALGEIISKDRLKGELIGGLSAGGAEIVAEVLMGDSSTQSKCINKCYGK